MNINRNDLLQVLESVQPGLTTRDVVEQSAHFAFKDGMVFTFNDEISCRRKSPLKITGAVHAVPLLNILRKLPEERVDIDVVNKELVIRGKRRRAGISMEETVTLPTSEVETPEEWKPLPEDFTEAINLAHQCAGKNESEYVSTCVHIHPKWIEACDNRQVIRYQIKTGINESTLVRASSIKHIVALDMTEFSETETWLHFRNPTGLILSCRRSVEGYGELDSILNVKGTPITIPKGLGEAADKAEIFSAENIDNNEVSVELRQGKCRILGQGVTGWYSEVKGLKYRGQPMKFCIAPKLLRELTRKFNDCFITDKVLKVDGQKFTFCLSLGIPSENGEVK